MRAMKLNRPATYADIEALPEHAVGEIVDGELYVSPRPRARHALAAGGVHGRLYGTFQHGGGGPGGWWILPEPELRFGKNVLVPDLAGWRIERMPQVPDVVGIELAPDWICEVLSPATARVDLMVKLPVYAKQGVAHAWIVDATNQTLQVFRLAGPNWILAGTYGGEGKVRAEPFDAIELDLGAWWPRAGPEK